MLGGALAASPLPDPALTGRSWVGTGVRSVAQLCSTFTEALVSVTGGGSEVMLVSGEPWAGLAGGPTWCGTRLLQHSPVGLVSPHVGPSRMCHKFIRILLAFSVFGNMGAVMGWEGFEIFPHPVVRAGAFSWSDTSGPGMRITQVFGHCNVRYL